jgi:hypothetical protein
MPRPGVFKKGIEGLLFLIRFLGMCMDLIGLDWLGLELEWKVDAYRCVVAANLWDADHLLSCSLPAERDAENILQNKRTIFPVPGRAH